MVSFLHHHGYHGHLDVLVATPPQGRLWEKCAYLECLLSYADRCGAGASACEYVTGEARKLLRVARSEKSVARVQSIIDGARQRLASRTDAGRVWTAEIGPSSDSAQS